MLKQQKIELIKVLDVVLPEESMYEALNGILNMIDTIQDAVVKDGFKKEKEVFNITDDEEEVTSLKVLDKNCQAF